MSERISKKNAGRPVGRICRGILLAGVILLVSCGPAPTPPATLTPTASPSATFTLTASPEPTFTPTLTPQPAWYQQLQLQLDETSLPTSARYALVVDPQTRVYASLPDAVAHNGNFGYLPTTPAYVAMFNEESRDGKLFYLALYGWIASTDLALLTPSTFRGLLMLREVPFRFGWVLEEVHSVNLAGVPIQAYQRYQVIHEVPATTVNPGYLAVGPDEWLPESTVASTRSQLPADSGPDTCRFIHVDLAEQVLRVFDECRLVFATLVSTGLQPGWTFPGRFAILAKFPQILLTPPAASTSVYYQEAVPHFMTYLGNLGFHGAYWHDTFGTPVSHGCINLSPADANWLYQWAWLGERVIISAGE